MAATVLDPCGSPPHAQDHADAIGSTEAGAAERAMARVLARYDIARWGVIGRNRHGSWLPLGRLPAGGSRVYLGQGMWRDDPTLRDVRPGLIVPWDAAAVRHRDRPAWRVLEALEPFGLAPERTVSLYLRGQATMVCALLIAPDRALRDAALRHELATIGALAARVWAERPCGRSSNRSAEIWRYNSNS